MSGCLIISCSKRKINRPGAAINVYDGNFFRILRNRKPPLDLFILSAKYGLIAAETQIEPYDQIMTKWKAVGIRPTVEKQYEKLVLPNYDNVLILMSNLYLGVLERVADNPQAMRIGANLGVGYQQQFLVEICENARKNGSDYVPAWVEAIKE